MILPPRSRPARIAAIVAAAVAILLLVLACFPWGVFRAQAERAISARIGAPATIGTIEREGILSLHPVLVLRDVRIAQPGWAGNGAMLRVARARVRLPVLPLLIGQVRPQPIAIENGVATLVRASDGRTNWGGPKDGGGSTGDGFARLAIRDLTIAYRDAKRDRRARVRVDSDGNGLRVRGTGALADEAVRVVLAGAPIDGRANWPFVARIVGPQTRITASGTMARALDTHDMRFDMHARGHDLLDLDRVIEAGLFGTQPVALNGKVSRQGEVWKIAGLNGTIGRSRLSAADATIDKSTPGRTRIDGDIRLAQLDFEDLSNTRGRAIAAAKRAKAGPRIVPDTRIDLRNVADIDGVLRVRADRLLSRFDSPFRRIAGTLTLENARLTVDPFTVGMTRGTLGGRIVVDQRDGKPRPMLALDLKLADTTIGTLAGGGTIDAPLRGMARLTGTGETVRAAIGRSSGEVALASGSGRIPSKLASFIGLDVGRGVFADKDAVATLRCLIVHMDVRDGSARMSPLLIDTSRSQSHVAGTIDLANERLDLTMTGAPKKDSILRLTEPVPVRGTIKSPDPKVPGGKTNVGGILKMVGDAIAGDRPPLATDADCGALAARAMR
ncbi:AsmA-like C-terminal region-containing protein [Sphingomonas sp.]|uniref:AsmA family protein n=1 Tax=Sphingomonas sp. TaxID=28214 RepID=UPI001ECB572F|nr:AsmA-like C-terminal region-containing protein [Sphingomonas sp.]MBX3593596.1 AsmA family protein [Sphingomonas sp.]